MRFRRGLSAAAAVLSLSLTAPVHASNHCVAITGTVVLPGWLVFMSPGLSLTPATQELWAYPWLAPTDLTLTCVRSFGSVTITGFPDYSWWSMNGASYAPEDLVSGAGSLGGGNQYTPFAVTATTGLDSGGYTTNGDAFSGVSLSNVRTPGNAALVVTLHGLVVDVDGYGGPIPEQAWGDVTVVADVLAEAYPAGGWSSVMYTWPAPGVAASA